MGSLSGYEVKCLREDDDDYDGELRFFHSFIHSCEKQGLDGCCSTWTKPILVNPELLVNLWLNPVEIHPNVHSGHSGPYASSAMISWSHGKVSKWMPHSHAQGRSHAVGEGRRAWTLEERESVRDLPEHPEDRCRRELKICLGDWLIERVSEWVNEHVILAVHSVLCTYLPMNGALYRAFCTHLILEIWRDLAPCQHGRNGCIKIQQDAVFESSTYIIHWTFPLSENLRSSQLKVKRGN